MAKLEKKLSENAFKVFGHGIPQNSTIDQINAAVHEVLQLAFGQDSGALERAKYFRASMPQTAKPNARLPIMVTIPAGEDLVARILSNDTRAKLKEFQKRTNKAIFVDPMLTPAEVLF